MQFCIAQEEKHFNVLGQVKWRSSGESWLEKMLQSEADRSALSIASGVFVTVYNYLIRGHREDGVQIFQVLSETVKWPEEMTDNLLVSRYTQIGK